MKQVFSLTAVLIILFFMGCNNKNQTDQNLMVTKELNENWTFNQIGKNEWLPATVPGTVHTDLLSNGKIEDPFYRLNEHDLQWIDKVDWEYKTTFTVGNELLQKDVVELDFKGLDTYADVFLNGKKVLSADNMFREWDANVKEFLKEGKNELLIIFRSPIVEGIKKYDAQGYIIPVSDNDLAKIGKVEGDKMVSIYTRKAGYHFGWDWGPRLVTSGIWRPIALNAWNKAKIENLQIIQNTVAEDNATFTAVFEIEAVENGKANLSIQNDGATLAKSAVVAVLKLPVVLPMPRSSTLNTAIPFLVN
jgi:beta-mannosidase